MNRRYLSIDSKFRDRNLFPQISSFEIPISQSGTKDSRQASDPVSDCTPLILFNGSFTKNGDTTINGSILLDGIGVNSRSHSFFIKCTTSNIMRTTDNFYRGSIIELSNTSFSIRRVISKFKYIGQIDNVDVGLVQVDQAIPDSQLFSTLVSINWKITNATETTLDTYPTLFIPTGDRLTNCYRNLIVYNETLESYSHIKSYDGETCMALLDQHKDDWLFSHDYTIRKTLPPHTSTFQTILDGTKFQLGPDSSGSSSYVGSWLRIKGSNTNDPDNIRNESRRIIHHGSYTASDGTQYDKVVTVSSPFSSTPLQTDRYEILKFTKDNVVPFVFTGSHISHQEMVSYEIDLVRLILPNVSLICGERLANFPYVWVELSNVSATGGGNKNIIYSNNPSSSKMLFKAPILDTSYSTSSKFLKINGDGTTQTVKFKINDNLRFSVRLPDGHLLIPEESDTQGPLEPNPLLNISATFSLRRVV